MRPVIPILLLIAALVGVPASPAQGVPSPDKGRIQGKVVDAKTGEGLPGANVTVKGTYYGGSSDFDGNVKIEKVNPGVYVLEVSLLGYKTVQFTNVSVAAGQTATIRARMEETILAVGQEVVVVGEKPLFDIEETSSRRNVAQADIQAAAVQDVQGLVSLQPGVVLADNEIHIRGGRASENAYLVDGISVQDPMAGTGFGLQLSPESIQDAEVITGGYNAEYGQATSGIVNITTREGTDRYSGTMSYKTDHPGNPASRGNWNTDIYNGTVSGPEPLTTTVLPALGIRIPGQMSFFATVYANLTDGYTRWVETVGADNRVSGYQVEAPHGLYSSIFPSGGGSGLSPRRSNNYSWMGKLTYRPEATTKIAYTYNQSVVIDQNTQTIEATLEHVEPNPGYQFLFQYIPDSANTFTQVNILHSVSWTQTLSKQTFFELRLSRYTAHVRGDANGKPFSSYIEPQDIVKYPVRYFNQSSDTVGVVPGDGFYDVGSPTVWTDHYMDEYTVKFDLTNFFTERNKFKTGVEMRFENMQMVDMVDPWVKPLGYDNDIYSVKTAQGALYAQDNITMSGMILNFGARLDYWMPGKYVDDVASDTSAGVIISPGLRQQYMNDTFSLFGRRFKARLSPRLGISHPVSDNQSLFFSYGHFSKFPRPQFVYAKLNRTGIRSSLPVGNPNLNPETTVAYELGIRNQLSADDVLTVTAYYKDIFDYVTQATVQRIAALGGAQYYTTYLNSDYGRSRGIEAEYIKRIGDWFRGTFSGSYSISTGKSSTPDESLFRLQQGQPENIKERYLIWDRPMQASVDLNFTVPKEKPLFGVSGLDDMNLFVRMFYESGKRYTPQIFTGIDAASGRPQYVTDLNNVNGSIGQYWFWIDLNFEKYFDLGFGRLVANIEVQNLLDRKNSQVINPATGRAYEYGDPTPNSYNDPVYPQLTGTISPFPYDPSRYLNPRTIRFSLAIRF
jgi:outer membrane receptor protein involved in Fe transport